MLADFVSCGFTASEFWQATPREVAAHFSGAKLRFDREFELAAWAAWRQGAVEHGKKYPSLSDFMGRKGKARRKSPAEIESVMRAWLGGRS